MLLRPFPIELSFLSYNVGDIPYSYAISSDLRSLRPLFRVGVLSSNDKSEVNYECDSSD